MTFPKNQQPRQRGQTVGEPGADEPFGFEPKPMLNEHHERNLLGGDGPIRVGGLDGDIVQWPPGAELLEGNRAHRRAGQTARFRPAEKCEEIKRADTALDGWISAVTTGG